MVFLRLRDTQRGDVKRPGHLRVYVVGIPSRIGKKVNALPDHSLYQHFGFAAVELPHILVVTTKPIGIGMGIEYIETGGYDKVLSHCLPHFFNGSEQESGTVFKASAIFSFPGVACQQFRNEIAMAGFDIYTIEPSLLGKQSRMYVARNQAVKVVIAYYLPIADHTGSPIQDRITLRYQGARLMADGSAISA